MASSDVAWSPAMQKHRLSAAIDTLLADQRRRNSTANLVLGVQTMPTSAADQANFLARLGALKLLYSDAEGAAADLDTALGMDRRVARAWRTRGLAKLQAQDFDGAIQDFTVGLEAGRSLSSPNLQVDLSGRALAKLGQGDFDGAIQDCDSALAYDEKFAQARSTRGFAKLRRNDWEGAIEDFSQESEHGNVDVLVDRAQARLHTGDGDGALEDCRRALRLDPKRSRAYSGRATVMTARGNFESALHDYNQALRNEPRSAELLGQRARARIGLRDYAAAVADCKAAIRLRPDMAEAWSSKGEAHLLLGDYDRAIADCAEALRLDPRNQKALKDGANAKIQKGHFKVAAVDLRKALELKPNCEDTKALLRRAEGSELTLNAWRWRPA